MYFAASSSKPEVTQHRGFITTQGHFHNHKQIDAKKAAGGDSNRTQNNHQKKPDPMQNVHTSNCHPRCKSKIINFCLFFQLE